MKSTLKETVLRGAWCLGNIQQTGSKSVFVSGCPRSGTTWLLETIESVSQARRVFEPFNRADDIRSNGHVECNFGLGMRPYLLPTARMTSLEHFLRDIFFRMPFEHMQVSLARDQSKVNTLNRLAGRGPTVVKFVRAQRLLPWITARFKLPHIILLRNPVSVVASQISNQSWNLNATLKEQIRSNDLISKNYPHFVDIFNECETFEEILACVCCIDYWIALCQNPDLDNRFVLSFEDAVENRGNALRLALRHLGVDVDDRIDTLNARPSSTTASDSDVLTGQDPRLTWKKRLSLKQSDKIFRILEKFQFNFYDDTEIFKSKEFDRFQKKFICGN